MPLIGRANPRPKNTETSKHGVSRAYSTATRTCTPSLTANHNFGDGKWQDLSGYRVQGSRFGVWGAGFRVQGSGFGVQGSGLRVQGSVFSVQCSGFTPARPGHRREDSILVIIPFFLSVKIPILFQRGFHVSFTCEHAMCS